MKHVASRAGVALKTVSRVVNGESGVTPETARRVLGAIQELGFRRNESARLLRTGQTATLGFIADTWTDPDRSAVYRGLENIAREHGYLLYSGSTDGNAEREEQLALAMCARRVDGLVISPAPGPHEYLATEVEAGVATVFVLRPSSSPAPSPSSGSADGVLADTVLPDERGGARAAVAHLIAQGHRKIGLLGVSADSHRSRQVRAGYAAAMSAAGLAADPSWAGLDARGLTRAPVSAVLCADHESTRVALRAAAGLPEGGPTGWPEGTTGRLAVVGFGDFELADVVTPPVTVLSYDPVLLGRTAGELLIARLGGEHGPARLVEVPVRLVVRGSAEFPPAR